MGRYHKNPCVLHREEDFGELLYDKRTRQLSILNRAGNFVLHMCDGKHESEHIARGLSSRFSVDFDKAMRDVEAILSAMRDKGWISEVVQHE